MDWTIPLKYQQADFLKRLSKQKVTEPSILNSDIPGCHSEMNVIGGDQLAKMLELCHQEAEKIAKNPPDPPSEYNSWIDFQDQFQREADEYFIREKLVDAIMSARLGKLVKKVKIDPLSNMEMDEEGNLRNESKFTYTLTADPTVSIQVKISDGESFNSFKKEKVRWLVTQEDINRHQVFIFISSFWFAYSSASGKQIEAILAGFCLKEQIEFSSPKAYIKPNELLYAGGLQCYLESLNPANAPPKEQILISETIQNLASDHPITTAVSNWRCCYTLTGHTAPINCLALSAMPPFPSFQGGKGGVLASGSRGEIRLWDINTGRLIATLSEYPWLDSWQVDEINSLAFSPDGQILIGGGADATLKIWHIGARDLIDILEEHKAAVRCVAYSPSGQTLATGGDDRKISLWNRRKREAFTTLSWGDSVPHSLAFSPNGQLLASGSYRKIKIWRLEDENVFSSPKAKLLHTLTAHSHIVSAVAFSPITSLQQEASREKLDGILISASRDRTIKLWHLKTGESIRTLEGHSGAIYAIAISPDGQTIASASEDKTVKLWHLETGALLGTFTGHTAQVNAVAFSRDGQTLASGSHDKTIKIWRRG